MGRKKLPLKTRVKATNRLSKTSDSGKISTKLAERILGYDLASLDGKTRISYIRKKLKEESKKKK